MKNITILLRSCALIFILLISTCALSQVTINSENFEGPGTINNFNTLFAPWVDGGNRAILDGNSRVNGANSIRLERNTGNASSIFTNNIDLTPYSSIDISFDFLYRNTENGDTFIVEYSNNGGTSYTTIGTFSQGTTFPEDTINNASITINNGGGTPFDTDSVLRIRATFNNNNDNVHIDDILIQGTVLDPEINIQGNAIDITSGSTTPSVADGTEFGSIIAFTTLDRTFTIQNTGIGALNLTGGTPLVDISGNAAFSILTQPTANNIPSGGGDLTFVVRFAPTGNTANVRAEISIDNNDSDENPYTFEVQASSSIDTDGDGVNDFTDIDDDNDGILDTIESTFVNRVLNNSFEMPDTDLNGANVIIGLGGVVPLAPPIMFNNWTIIGDIDVANINAFGAGALAAVSAFVTGDQFIDILGSGPAESWPAGTPLIDDPAYVPNGIEQIITTLTPGQVYQFSFDYSGNTDANMAAGNLFINGVFIEEVIFTSPVAFTKNTYRRNFTATGVDTIRLIASRTGGDTGAPGLLVDNFVIMESVSVNNADGDTRLNHLDLDSDNDGIPDIVEAGGYDTDGNGIVDVLTDSDNNGLADIYDTGSNFGNRDSDGDSHLNFLDLDSDNDGIVDLIEAGGIDSDANAIIDGFTDADSNGYNDSNDGLGSILITGPDGNADGIPDTYPNGNSDATGFPDFMDIDSDDDGITDNTEAQTTIGYITYTTVDTDQDGILDIFDNSNTFGGNGLTPIDTDFDCIPDYLDTNSDEDNENDRIEGHDTNGDGIVDGGDTPNAGTGLFTGTDTDEDGLDDGFDNTISGISATNSNLQATSHPNADGLFDRDWRSSNLPIDFDGVDDHIDFGNQLNLTGNFSLEAWVLEEVSRPTSGIISKRDIKSGNLRGYHLAINNGFPNLTWYNNSGAEVLNITSSHPINDGRWHHIAATYDGSEAKIYIDGLEVAVGNTSISPSANTNKFMIGAMFDSDFQCIGSFNHFNGFIDEVRIWETALTESQIREMMNQEIENNGDVRGSVTQQNISNSLSWSNLMGYFPMIGNVVQDKAGTNTGIPKNISTIEPQTAPLPYISTQDGDWDVTSTWTNGNVQTIPGSASIIDANTTIDWNIVRINNNVTLDNSGLPGVNEDNRTVLGLFVESEELTVVGDNATNTGNGITITHYLKLDGKIDLEGESQLIQSLDSELDVTSSGNLERDQQGTSNTFTYNYWSSPVGTINTTSNNNDFNYASIFHDGSDASNPIPINFTTSGFNGSTGTPITLADFWIFKFTDFTAGNIAGFQQVRSTGTIEAGQGFTLKGVDAAANVSDFQNYVAIGKPNNGDISLSITAGNNYLVGNPYASALDAEQFILDNGPVIDGGNADGEEDSPLSTPGITGTLYFWEHFGGGSHVLREYQGGYGTYNLSGATPAAFTAVSHPDVSASGIATKTPGRYIPVGQGFFVLAETTGTVDFNNGQRAFVKEDPSGTTGDSVFVGIEEQDDVFVDNNNTSASNQEDIEDIINDSNNITNESDSRIKIRVGFNSVNTYHRQLLVTVDERASFGFDWGFDGGFNEDQLDDMYWIVEDLNYNIQGIDTITDDTVLPLGFHTDTDGDNNITIDLLENVPDNIEIFLVDHELNTTHDIRRGGIYEFFSVAGEHMERFEITFEVRPETNNDDEEDTEDEDEDEDEEDELLIGPTNEVENITVFYSNDTDNIIIINPELRNITSVEMINIIGQTIFRTDTVTNQDRIQYQMNKITTGTYIIRLNSEEGIITRKVIVN